MESISGLNPSRVLVAGDWHRNPFAAWPKRVIALASQIGIDTIVHVGDFGYKYASNDAYTFEKPLHRALLDANIKLIWVDGNHENHELLRSLPLREDGFIQTGARGNIFHAPRGVRWEWSGKSFGALGGAWSPNWRRLVEGKTLFYDLEETTWEDLAKLGDAPLDYLIAHDVPERVALKSPLGVTTKTQTREVLQKAVDRTKPLRVFSGHWHERLDFRIPRSDGFESFGHILTKEWNKHNVLILDLVTDEIIPLPDFWLGYDREKL